MFSPTVSNSCSTSLNLPSANSARSLALLSSSSCTPNFLVNSSSFCSLSLAILVVSLRFLSASSISTSFLMVLFSKYLTFLRIPSASLDAMASLVTVSARDESAFLASSSINMIRLDNALTSSSAFLNLLSQITDVSLMLVIFGVSILGVSLVTGNGGQELIGLRLERLHLLPDGIHG